MAAFTLQVACWNFEDFGWDMSSRSHARLPLFGEVIAEACPDVDVLMVQEARQGGYGGGELVFAAEERLRGLTNDRGFLRAYYFPPVTGQSLLGQVIFLCDPLLRAQRQYVHGAPDVYHDQEGFLHARLGDTGHVVKIKSLHWPHWSGDQRLDAALKLTGHAAPGALTILAGDCNSLWPNCRGHREFEPKWRVRPPHKRFHKTLPPGLSPGLSPLRPADVVRRLCHWLLRRDPRFRSLSADRRALRVLAEAGFRSAGCVASDMTPTVNAHIDDGQGGRIDHLIVSPALHVVPGSYRVHVSERGNRASDHRLVHAEVRIPLPCPLINAPHNPDRPATTTHITDHGKAPVGELLRRR
ncbi:endonuclease/exonuclease/phosphatase family protein [Actinomadura sp. SCN-SB]|uniref:endonuclease/exonuclease/phosphatase family protein n=1 Tax=Actinomadura sp. SCN-SB TaxID=3373092 RepID=UPI003751BF80